MCALGAVLGKCLCSGYTGRVSTANCPINIRNNTQSFLSLLHIISLESRKEEGSQGNEEGRGRVNDP